MLSERFTNIRSVELDVDAFVRDGVNLQDICNSAQFLADDGNVRVTFRGNGFQFIALPGGCGTLDELFEIVTWAQLGIHQKPIGLLNVRGYFDPLDAFLAKAVEEKFLRPEHRSLLAFHTDPAELVAALEGPPPVSVEKWLDRGQR